MCIYILFADAYDLLCGDSTRAGIDECALRPDICGGGRCIDTPDGYKCECHQGFKKGQSQVCEGQSIMSLYFAVHEIFNY